MSGEAGINYLKWVKNVGMEFIRNQGHKKEMMEIVRKEVEASMEEIAKKLDVKPIDVKISYWLYVSGRLDLIRDLDKEHNIILPFPTTVKEIKQFMPCSNILCPVNKEGKCQYNGGECNKWIGE